MELNKKIIDDIIKKIKENKKYRSISNSVIEKEIEIYSKKNILNEDKETIKQIRSNLHKSYSSFQTRKKLKSKKLLEELKEKINNKKSIEEISKELLSITLSTKERLDSYSTIYEKIFSEIKKPKTIIDLGSGLNPISILLTNLKNIDYFSYDIDEEDFKLLNDFFQIIKSQGINGKASILDLRDFQNVSKLPEADIILLFKVLDILDKDDHKTSEEIIKILIKKSKLIVVSFATKTLTRKKMNFPNRKWFELMLERNNHNFKTLIFENEIFYIIWN